MPRRTVTFGAARQLAGLDRGALVVVWIGTLGFLALAVTGLVMSMVIAAVSLLVAVPWTVSVLRR